MLWRDLVTLLAFTTTTDSFGGVIPGVLTRKDVFADKQSIRQSEFYQAMQTGLRPELMFVVRSSDYSGESQLEYNSKTYNILRTYDKNGETVELICQGAV